jgi:polyisoprenoid-binding protein YceI
MKKVVVAVVAVAVVAAAGFWFFVLRDDPPDELSLSETDAGADGTGGESETGGGSVEVDGTWMVVSGDPTAAGLRIDETFLSGIDHTAVGRTSEVTGSLTIAGATVTEGSFTADLTALSFSDAPPGLDVGNRSRALQTRGLETDLFPEAMFTLTAPIELGAVPAPGEAVTAEATGDLTLHGVTREITVPVDAQVLDDGRRIEVVSADPVTVALADYDMEPPVAGPIAEVAPEGSFEFKLVLTKG